MDIKDNLNNKYHRAIILRCYIAIVFSSFTAFLLCGKIQNNILVYVTLASALEWYVMVYIFMKVAKPIDLFAKSHFKRIDSAVNKLSDRLFFLICWLGIVILWLPAYLALFPGTLGYDTPFQLNQWFGIFEMTDHQPIAHTVLLGILYTIGSKLGGAPNFGVALYTAFQGLVVTGALAYTILVFRKNRIPIIYQILTFFWFSFNPFLQGMTFNSSKDFLYGAMMLLFCLFLFQWIKNGKTNNKRLMILYIISGILTCLFRHQGIYILSVFLLFLFIAPNLRKKKKWLIISTLSVIVIFEIFSIFCHGVLNIKPGDSREMLSVPMQQIAYVGKLKLEGQNVSLSDEDLARIETFIPENGILSYSSNSADPVKSTFDTKNFKSDLANNIKIYMKLGIQNPKEYLVAFRDLTAGYINYNQMGYAGLMYLYPFQGIYEMDIHRDSGAFTWYYDLLVYNTVGGGIKNHPIMSVLFNPSLPIWLLTALLGIVFYRRDYSLWLVILPMLLYAVSIFLGPVALLRYLYPLILFVPFLIFCCYRKCE